QTPTTASTAQTVPAHETVTTVNVPPAIAAIVAAPDRSAEDKAMDAGRRPGETLAFFGVAPGMKVAEIAAGRGYTSELLARAVGESGKVWAVNNKTFLGFVGEEWAKRLATPPMKNVVRVDRELDDPLPPEAKDLDVVLDVLNYHDTVWMKVDRDKMNGAIFAALKPGGVYGIIDHSGRAGAGTNEVQTNHRIEESTLIADVLKSGFKLQSEADILRNPSDTRDWNPSPRVAGARRGTSDRFMLKFVKPMK
ncbi:MAG TPA: SAM-dependent methyltransferase, partial [Polyangiaceae bacterium]|nr:SAM-dependent methyltransferase [Polyangiaceae bacterium]